MGRALAARSTGYAWANYHGLILDQPVRGPAGITSTINNPVLCVYLCIEVSLLLKIQAQPWAAMGHGPSQDGASAGIDWTSPCPHESHGAHGCPHESRLGSVRARYLGTDLILSSTYTLNQEKKQTEKSV